ncbi:MAG: SDR family NAD(P)-dependent oxidoreductase [Solirubrobacterales bacterium]
MRNLVVTGASGGMGREVLRLLAARDVNVVCVDLDEESVQGAIDVLGETRGEFVAHGADVSEESAVEAYISLAVDRWGGLDGLFNMAGIEGELLPMAEATIENYDKVMAVNARGVFLGMMFALPHLLERGGGTIISTGSYLAIRGVAACGPYGASKHAIVGMTKTLAVEVAEQNVRANVVCPGSMDTRMIRELYPSISDDPVEAEAVLTQGIPQKRLAQPEELASTGVWLLLDAPAHMTGQVIMVDGGLSAA